MRIAVMSDLHDNVKSWERIAAFLKDQQIQTVINCGDTAAPAMLQEMSRTFSGQMHTVFGNVADRELEMEVVKKLPNVTHYGDRGEVTLANKNIAFTHRPQDAKRDIESGDFDLVCHGHTHLKRWEPSTTPRAGRRVLGTAHTTPAGRVLGDAQPEKATMILNPGTAGGMFQYPSFAVVDLVTMTCNFEEVTL